MTDETLRTVEIERTGRGHFVARNRRGGTLATGQGDDEHFSPVELLLVAIGACGGIDVDLITGKRAEPTEFTVRVSGDKVRDGGGGNRMVNLRVEFSVAFPDGEAGDAAREALPRAVQMSHDRLCTVSRTVELGTEVSTSIVK